ncbi:MAG: YceI family protein [Polyangiaceae bacterium]
MQRPASALALVLLAALASSALGALAGCGKKEDATTLAPASSALAASTASPTTATWHYTLDSKGTAHVEMPGLSEHIVGDTSAASGSLDVSPADLAQSRGLVRIDLSTFTTHTFGNDKDADQTRHARTWLEAVVDGKVNEDMRWAEYAIRSIDGLSATDLAKVAATSDADGDVRTVTLTTHGDLRIHGRQVQKDDVVTVAFRYPKGAAADAKPTRIEITPKQPIRVILKEYDVQPRDPGGKALAWTTSLLSKVAETADVTFDLTAAPAP